MSEWMNEWVNVCGWVDGWVYIDVREWFDRNRNIYIYKSDEKKAKIYMKRGGAGSEVQNKYHNNKYIQYIIIFISKLAKKINENKKKIDWSHFKILKK